MPFMVLFHAAFKASKLDLHAGNQPQLIKLQINKSWSFCGGSFERLQSALFNALMIGSD